MLEQKRQNFKALAVADLQLESLWALPINDLEGAEKEEQSFGASEVITRIRADKICARKFLDLLDIGVGFHLLME